MAENKKSFILYSDLIYTVEKLTDEQSGKLFKHILEYVNDMNPETDDPIVDIVFAQIEQQLKRDLKKWEKKKEDFSHAGKESAKSRRLQKGNQLYVLRVFNKDEEFVKVGITSHSVGRRFSSKGEGFSKTDYSFEIIHQIFIDDPLSIEKRVGVRFRTKSYQPKQKFPGHMECFSIESLNMIVQFLTTLNNVEQTSTNPTDSVNDNVNDNVNVNVSTIVDYLNSRVGSNYKATTRKTKECINARINEGFTVDDFKTVIDIKANEWESDPKFSKFLRPETLFSPKFEGYLNQQQAKPDREEDLQVELLKHLKNVQSENDNIESPDNNRLRRIS